MMETIMPLETLSRHASTRRELLLGSGVLFAWAFVPKVARAEGRDPRLLTIVLRGALDGLAAVAPVGDPDWIKLRGDNALRLDGKIPALPLDGFFALNPAMPNVHRLYQDGQATIVHAVATPYRERSHFDGQDVLESGLPKPGAVDSGWLNRALAGLAPGGPTNRPGRQAFAVGPVSCHGHRRACRRSATRPPCGSSSFIVTPIRRWRACSRIAWRSPPSPAPVASPTIPTTRRR
jgi:uncharacterized protein (DUF1501 family)